jgi:Polysaccharide lyase family 4, domain II
MRVFVARLTIVGLLALAAGAWVADRAAAADTGTVTGQFVLAGEIPKLAPLVKQGDTTVKDPEVCSKQNVPDQSLVVDESTKGIANVFVYLQKPPADMPADLKESKEKIVKFDQKNCQFIPHTLILRTDQSIEILSDDPISHNTHVYPIRQDGKNEAIAANDRSGNVKWQFTVPEKMPTTVKCDIHSWMEARWLIIDHPYAAITDKEGRFKIENVPAGEHNFVIWHERAGWVFGATKRSIPVTVEAGKTTQLGNAASISVPVANFEKK